MKKYYTKEFENKLIQVCTESESMAKACSTMQMHFNTFKKHAKRLNVYNPNQAGKNISKKMPSIPLQEILNGLHPQYQTNHLRKRLIKEKILEKKCMYCLNTEWQGKPIPLELHHTNGNKYDHRFINLHLVCPNCHAQTSTYRGKNVKH